MSAQPTVTIGRVEAWLKSEGLNYDLDEDGDVLTGFENCVFNIINRGGQFLSVSTVWRADLGETDEAAMRVFVDEHNRSKYGPRATVTTGPDGGSLCADMSAMISKGMSDAQLKDFLHGAFGVVIGFYDGVEEQFPALVTWNEEN